MQDLTNDEIATITKNICPDCGAKGEFIGGPSGGGSQNIICNNCKMRFNVGMGSGERIGKETFSESEPLSIPEGTIVFKEHNRYQYLTHSCGGGINLYNMDEKLAVLVCSKCFMRLKLPQQELTSLNIGPYKMNDLFVYLKTHRPWDLECAAKL